MMGLFKSFKFHRKNIATRTISDFLISQALFSPRRKQLVRPVRLQRPVQVPARAAQDVGARPQLRVQRLQFQVRQPGYFL